MNSRGLLAVVAFLLAATATTAVFLYVKGVRDDAQTSEQVTVVVASEDIPAGADLDDEITAGVFTTTEIAEDDLVDGAVTDLAQLDSRTTRYPILAGEQITTARLQGSEDELPGGVLGIPEGFSAVSVALDAPRVVGGALEAGDHVTIYGTFRPTGGGQANAAQSNGVTVNLVPDVQVLRVRDAAGGESVGSGIAGQATVTLALRPKDAQKLVFAQEQGTVWFGLLGPNEKGVQTPPLTIVQVVR